jgi:aspartyl-tRNA(Asn)/glutamyl-tRNA(Gln) amidotransferase subunit C
MALDRDDVLSIAHLARLAISDADIPEYARNLSRILDFVAEMNAVDTSGLAPMAHPLDMPQRLRADVITEHDQRALFQSVAPLVEEGYFLVPKVIE